MISLNKKSQRLSFYQKRSLSELNLILMTNGIKAVSEQNDCNIDATQERSNLGAWVEKFQGARKAVLGSLAAMTAIGGTACAQEAPVQHAELVKGTVTTAPAEKTPDKAEADEFDLDALIADADAEAKAKTKEAEATGEELAQKTEAAESSAAIRKAAEDILD